MPESLLIECQDLPSKPTSYIAEKDRKFWSHSWYSNYIIDQLGIYPLMVIIFTAVCRAQVIETFCTDFEHRSCNQ